MKEIFFLGLGVTVTEINIKKVQKQDLKKHYNVKDEGMACQKVCKQGRDDIIVKVSLQSLIPASFSHRFHISFTLSFYILIFFKSLYVSSVHCGYPQIMLAHKSPAFCVASCKSISMWLHTEVVGLEEPH